VKKSLPFIAAVAALAALGLIFGRVVSSFTSGAFVAAVATVILFIAYYRYLKTYNDKERTALTGVLEFLALVFVGAIIVYALDAILGM
jgi:hypothetical protein